MNILTRSPEGGCVTVAVMREGPPAGATAAESMVVSGSETEVRLSHERTGAAFATSGFGGAPEAGAPDRGLANGPGRRPRK